MRLVGLYTDGVTRRGSWIVMAAALAACGRAGFESRVDGANRPDAPEADPDALGADAPASGSDAPGGDVTVTFGETPTADIQGVTADTSIDGEAGKTGLNYGADTRIQAEGSQERALLRFEVSAIPAGKTIVAAKLRVYVTSNDTGTSTIRSVLEAWTEGTQNGTAGVCNWTQRTAGQAWTTAGAGAPGSASAQIASFQTTGALGPLEIPLPPATVQGWVDAPATNFGLVIAGGEASFASREATTASQRPELVVTYTP